LDLTSVRGEIARVFRKVCRSVREWLIGGQTFPVNGMPLLSATTTHSPFIIQSPDGHGVVNSSDRGSLEERIETHGIEDIAE